MAPWLTEPFCGFAKGSQVSWTQLDEPLLTLVDAHTPSKPGGPLGTSGPGRLIQSIGAGTSATEAFIPALAELLERHAAATFHEEQFLWRSAADLREHALDLNTIPRCSEREMAHPRCSLQRPVAHLPIRWVRGLSLLNGEPILVPAVMVYSHAGWRVPQERFWLPISTGCAAHVSYEQALLSGLCEVVERDAISVLWLQRLQLPRIVLTEPTEAPSNAHLRSFWQLRAERSAGVEYHFFNATTDMGLPTVYGIAVSLHHPYARTTVSCATALTFEDALLKALKDLVVLGRAFQQPRRVPEDTMAFTGLLDGAAYMARPEHAEAFTFLLASPHSVSLADLCASRPAAASLQEVLQTFAQSGIETFAVDLSTDEALRAGFRVVRVLVPTLQPLSLHTAVQFRAHPRLYQAPKAMGLPAYPEEELNTWPQPFA